MNAKTQHPNLEPETLKQVSTLKRSLVECLPALDLQAHRLVYHHEPETLHQVSTSLVECLLSLDLNAPKPETLSL